MNGGGVIEREANVSPVEQAVLVGFFANSESIRGLVCESFRLKLEGEGFQIMFGDEYYMICDREAGDQKKIVRKEFLIGLMRSA
ncbi:hypothetical protein IMZ31_18815 (plasmid) [Pontibacillus sp. ALD_SL1]|uniref:hypothetical protein n=1 Tax=Pontibacillus sp. ALD_SL1 TaxID=2777185 RepID=UPI001A96D5E3|nr:hypothetical protein [Pontibacillus sp. ALD_SL1]QST02601.1 hypothetical protein IMZ31_18815 [Pontibacillus sp. ALD_SL1]